MTLKQNIKGFSLVELLVVITIIGVLTAIALPAYNEYLAKAARSDAKAAMLALAQAEERFYSNQVPPVYLAMAGPPTNTVSTLGPAWINWSGGDSIDSRKYAITITLDPATMLPEATQIGSMQSYLIEAVPVGNLDPKCGTLRLFSNGQKQATGGSNCW